MNLLPQNNNDDEVVDQRCLRHAWANYQKSPGSRIMMGPGLDKDSRHFWIVKIDGTVVDTTPGHDSYPYYSQGEVFDIDNNINFLTGL